MSLAEDAAALAEFLAITHADPVHRTAAELRRAIDPRALSDPEAEARTLGQVAAAVGVSVATIQAWEEGSASPSTLHLAATWLRYIRREARLAPGQQFPILNGAHS